MPYKDKKKRNEAVRRHYANHPEAKKHMRQKSYAKKHRTMAINKVVRAAFKNVPCYDCKQRYPHYVMQFDHLHGKKFTISSWTHSSLDTLVDEILKCQVVCANCHAIRTHERRSNPMAQ